jgi:hypothetical protein
LQYVLWRTAESSEWLALQRPPASAESCLVSNDCVLKRAILQSVEVANDEVAVVAVLDAIPASVDGVVCGRQNA